MTNKGFRITVEGSDKVITCQNDEPLLAALARQGYAKIPVGCRQGGCGVCKIRVIEGKFELGKMSIKHVTQAERDQNFSLACKTFPKSNLTVALIKREKKSLETKSLFDQNC